MERECPAASAGQRGWGRMGSSGMLTPVLLKRILQGYPLPLDGIHGPAHWARVLENGRRLAKVTKADLEVVELFSVFHDACRRNDDRDPKHGARGAILASRLLAGEGRLSPDKLEQLQFACRLHTRGLLEADLTVQTCWDADRLDLLRVGTLPEPELLCTEAARSPSIMAWANSRASGRNCPRLLTREWGIHLQ
jgi:uncharacterized protein